MVQSSATLPYMKSLLQDMREKLSTATETLSHTDIKKSLNIFIDDEEVVDNIEAMKLQYLFTQQLGEGPRTPAALTTLLFAIMNGETQHVPLTQAVRWEANLWPFILQHSPQVAIALSSLSEEQEVSEEVRRNLIEAIKAYSATSGLVDKDPAAAMDRAAKYWGLLPSRSLR